MCKLCFFVIISCDLCKFTANGVKMDRRDLANAFRGRFRQLLDEFQDDLPGFLKRARLDRSALSQLRDPEHDRLPRAETLRRIAEATGASVDWLLALENAREGRQKMTESSELLTATDEEGIAPLELWRSEAKGHKLRYVPAVLPDMLSLANQTGGAKGEEKILTGFDIDEMDLEIAMPIQTLETMASRTGIWHGKNAEDIQKQITHIAELCDAHYPVLRLHLFDARVNFSAPFTVFGRIRASVYVGQAYISVTRPEEVKFFTKKFDGLVRAAAITPDAVPEYIDRLLS